ncbi:MAG: insulinase family protein [Chlamydiia bacterium]|nr:insulinase family protein [Chlamydiia bacterium]
MTQSLSSIGQQYRQFKVSKFLVIDELACTLTELEHLPTGAKIMHIGNDDPENLFSLSLQTVPYNSNGVAHILEHTVLCGSKKFPVRDPFFAMTRRSLNTFMNALTGQDFTCYPAASQIPKDFYNLLDVYLDAVFHPKLDKLSFLQEGHRLEFEEAEDPKTPLEYKGVVFNEMKGALSSPTSRVAEALYAALYPDVTYGYNSGGNPADIPSLTYEELIDFHKTFYHPSRCLFFFYGNIQLERHLDFLHANLLDHVSRVEPLQPVPHQPRFSAPKRVTESYPISPDEDPKEKCIISFGWLTCTVLEQLELLALTILETALMSSDAAPLKMALLKSGLCKQASAYIDPDIADAPVIINLKGCSADDADAIEEVMFSTLKRLADEGIAEELIEDAMHQLEFHRSEITGDHSPFGLTLFFRSALIKQHGATPEDGLRIHTLFHKIHAKLERNPKYFSSLIEKYLINNTHFVRLVMTPDKELDTREAQEEAMRLKKIQSALTEKEITGLIGQARQLADYQKAQEDEDLSVLPTITLADVPKECIDYPLTHMAANGWDIYHHDCFTNKIVYADIAFSLPPLTEEELTLVRLLTTLIPQMGCGGRNYADTLQYMQAHTGGIEAATAINVQTDNLDNMNPTLHIKGKALYHKSKQLFSLLKELINGVDFSDIDRLREAFTKHFTVLQGSFVGNAMKYAIALSSSRLNLAGKMGNAWSGIAYYEMLRQYAEDLDNQIQTLSEKLTTLQNRLLCTEKPALVISCDTAHYHQLQEQKFYGLLDTPLQKSEPWKAYFTIDSVSSQGRIIASPVAFTAKAMKTICYDDPKSAALAVASHLLDNTSLHRLLREQGGAYGGGSGNSTSTGQFYFYAYRDPNLNTTLKAFESAIQSLLNGDFTDEQLTEAVFEVIQSLDMPISPGSRADVAFSWLKSGKTLQKRQQFRDRLLRVNRADVCEALQKCVAGGYHEAATVVFAGKELFDREMKEQGAEKLELIPLV